MHSRLPALLRNAGVVFTGKMTNGVIGLVYLAVLTRALDIETFGHYALYGAYVAVVGRLCSFQSWQALISYGARAREAGDNDLFFGLMGFGLGLDVATGVVGYVIALAGALYVPHWFGLAIDPVTGTAIAAVALLFNWSSGPIALLRLEEKYAPQAIIQNLGSLTQLLIIVVLYLYGVSNLLAYLAVTAMTNALGQLALFAYALKLGRERGVVTAQQPAVRRVLTECSGIARFVVTTNADGLVRVLREVDIFIVNALLDAAAAGLYRVARNLTSAMGRLTGPFFQTVYPEFAALVARGRSAELTALMTQVALLLTLVTGAAWLGFWLLGEELLGLAFGAEYIEAYELSLWCLLGMVIWGASLPLSPALMAWQLTGRAMLIHMICSIIYLASLPVAVDLQALEGAGMALALFYFLWALVTLTVVRIELTRRSGVDGGRA